MTEQRMARMRDCFRIAAVWEGWSEVEREATSADIRSAVEANDEEQLEWWLAHLEMASGLDFLSSRCRAFEARVREERAVA